MKRKKLSKYNVYEWENDEVAIYNTYSGGVLGLNKEYTKKFKKLLQLDDFELSCDDDLGKALVQGAMILDYDVDESRVILVQSYLSRFANESVAFTIAPTMECNFRCPYCYENGKRYNTMDERIINKTIEFINTVAKNKSKVSVAWYGGEPLLRMDIIETITSGIEKKENYSAQIVTNGYYLTESNAIKLKELNVEHAQVTIDGPPEIHNKRRRLPNGEDTFFVIMENIKKAAEHIHINIRINVDKSNMDRADEVLDYIISYGIADKVGVYIAPVDEINEGCIAPNCYTDAEFAVEQIKFAKRNMEKGLYFVDLPGFNPGLCGAVSPNCYIIDPIGDLYKCWDHVGYKEEIIGNIFDNDINIMQSNYMKWIDYDIFQYEECKHCSVLPICMGGCPYKNLKNRKMCCDAVKFNANEMVQLLKEFNKGDCI